MLLQYFSLGKNTFCILAEKDSTARIKNIIKSGMYDVIYPSWFLSQLYVENKEIPKLKPENFLAMSTRTKQLFAKSYDEFGDHYTLPSTKDTIKYPMMMAKKKVIIFFHLFVSMKFVQYKPFVIFTYI